MVGDLSVHARVVGTGTAVAPGHDAGQVGGAGVRAGKGAARVTLARVLAALGHSGTDHGVLNVALAISIATLVVRHDGNGHLLEGTGGAASFSESAPAGHDAVARGSVTLSGNIDGANVVVEAQRLRKLEQGDVVADGEAVVVLVLDDLGEDDRLLVALIHVEVMLSGHDLIVVIIKELEANNFNK